MSKSRYKKRRAVRRPPTEYAAQGYSKRRVRHYENFIAPPTERASMAQVYVVNEIIPVPTRIREEIIRKPIEDVPENFLEPESTRSEISDLSFLSSRSRTQSKSSTDMTIESLGSIGDIYQVPESFFSYVNPINEELENRVGFSRPYYRDLNREEVSRISGTVSPFSFTDESIRSSATESPVIPIRYNESPFIPIRSPENIDTRASISESILASDSQNEDEKARLGVKDIDIGNNRLNYGPVQRQIHDMSRKIEDLTSKGQRLHKVIQELEQIKAPFENLNDVNNQMKDTYKRLEQAKNFQRLLQEHFDGRIDLFSEPYQGFLTREIKRAPTNYQMQLAELLGQNVSTIQSSEAMGSTTLKYQYPDAYQTDNECFQISIEGDMITVDHLKYPNGQANCKEPGPRLLNALKAFAEKTNKQLQIGIDASSVTLDSGLTIPMAPYKILTKGQSWYNSQGFINKKEHEENVRANKKLLDMKLSNAVLEIEKKAGHVFVPSFVERMIMREPGTKVKDLVDVMKNLVEDQTRTGQSTRLSVKENIRDILALLSPLIQYKSDSLVYVPNSESFYETYN